VSGKAANAYLLVVSAHSTLGVWQVQTRPIYVDLATVALCQRSFKTPQLWSTKTPHPPGSWCSKGWRPSVCDGRQPAKLLGRYASGFGASIAVFDFSRPALSFSLSR
jgi:hypothetical protein